MKNTLSEKEVRELLELSQEVAFTGEQFCDLNDKLREALNFENSDEVIGNLVENDQRFTALEDRFIKIVDRLNL
jgi:hypothetical protein